MNTQNNSLELAIVIPTYNRPERLLTCLKSIIEQSLPKEKWEVVVVDDGSIEDMSSAIGFIESQANFSYIKQENQGPATARNNGVKHTKADYIAFLDDDCELHKDWLKTLLEHKDPDTIVGGHTINKLKNNNNAEASQLLITYLYEYLLDSPMLFFTSNNFMVPRKGFFEEGAFDTDFRTSAGEDRELCIRWTLRGRKLKYVPEALIYHSHNLSFRTFTKQHFKYGRASNTFRYKISFEGIDLQFSRWDFYSKLISYPFGQDQFSFFRKCLLTFLILWSQVLNSWGNRFDRLAEFFSKKEARPKNTKTLN